MLFVLFVFSVLVCFIPYFMFLSVLGFIFVSRYLHIIIRSFKKIEVFFKAIRWWYEIAIHCRQTSGWGPPQTRKSLNTLKWVRIKLSFVTFPLEVRVILSKNDVLFLPWICLLQASLTSDVDRLISCGPDDTGNDYLSMPSFARYVHVIYFHTRRRLQPILKLDSEAWDWAWDPQHNIPWLPFSELHIYLLLFFVLSVYYLSIKCWRVWHQVQ